MVVVMVMMMVMTMVTIIIMVMEAAGRRSVIRLGQWFLEGAPLAPLHDYYYHRLIFTSLNKHLLLKHYLGKKYKVSLKSLNVKILRSHSHESVNCQCLCPATASLHDEGFSMMMMMMMGGIYFRDCPPLVNEDDEGDQGQERHCPPHKRLSPTCVFLHGRLAPAVTTLPLIQQQSNHLTHPQQLNKIKQIEHLLNIFK